MMMLPTDYVKLICTGLLLVGGFGSQSARAQDNPFGDIPSATPSAAQSNDAPLDRPAISPALSESTQLIIRAVEQANPQSEIELAKALRTMLDLDQYDQARYYLSRLQALSLNDVQRFQLYETLGTDFFLELHAATEMQPEGAGFSKQVLAAARVQASSPERFRDLIKRLSDADGSARSEAFRKLRRLGPAAAAEMIAVFTELDRQAEFPFIRSALRSLGDDAIAPLLGAARANNLLVQAEAVRALGHYRSAEATDTMMRTYLSPLLPESLRRVALDSLMTSERLPADPGYVEDRFYQRAQDFLLGRRQLIGVMDGTISVWQWDTESNRLTPIVVSSATAMRLSAAQIATDLFEISPASPRNRALYLLTQLEFAKRVAGPSSAVDVDALMKRFPSAAALEIEALLAEALKLNLIPAAIACCELLGEIGSADLLLGSTQQTRPLMQAIQLGDRHLQFAAFQAISKLDPQSAYSGSSFMLMLGVYLASSENRGAGLVGHNRPDMAQTYAATLQTAGLFGKSVTSSREFFDAAIRDPDLELLLITDTLDKPDYAELIQQLRKDLRTKRLPIGLLVRDMEHGARVQRMVVDDPFFTTMPISLEPQQVASHVQRLLALANPWPVTELDRRRHATTAIQWLNQISNDRQQYRFYDLGKYQDELARMLYLPGFAEPSSQILRQLGTPLAQRELLNFVGQSSLPLEERRKAAEAFSQAINTGGTLLTREEILQQYDRYNASATEPIETQQLLGSILDALEARGKSEIGAKD